MKFKVGDLAEILGNGMLGEARLWESVESRHVPPDFDDHLTSKILHNGDMVIVLDTRDNVESNVWYQIMSHKGIGWVSEANLW